jgi:hypothetical protein
MFMPLMHGSAMLDRDIQLMQTLLTLRHGRTFRG